MLACYAIDEEVEIKHAVDSLREELDAIKKYSQRIAMCASPELKSIMKHNLKEEREHAMKLLVWLRTNS